MRLFTAVIVICIASLQGCVSSPSVHIVNDTPNPVIAYVQVPRRSSWGYPPPASRTKVTLAVRQSVDAVYDPGRRVQDYSYDPAVAVRLPDGRWQLCIAKIGSDRRVAFRLTAPRDAVIIQSDHSTIDAVVPNDAALEERLGKKIE
jgi:hypothetical protein